MMWEMQKMCKNHITRKHSNVEFNCQKLISKIKCQGEFGTSALKYLCGNTRFHSNLGKSYITSEA